MKFKPASLYKAKLPSSLNDFTKGEVYDLNENEELTAYGDRMLNRFAAHYPRLVQFYQNGKTSLAGRIQIDNAPVFKVEDIQPIARVS